MENLERERLKYKQLEIKFQKYWFAHQELNRAYKFVTYLIDNRMHKPFPRGKNKSIQQEAFTISFIVTYTKPFIQNTGYGKLDFKTGELSSEQRAVHNMIIDLRQKAFAHIDSTLHKIEHYPDFLLLNSPFINIAENQCLILKEIIEVKLKNICQELTKLRPKTTIYLRSLHFGLNRRLKLAPTSRSSGRQRPRRCALAVKGVFMKICIASLVLLIGTLHICVADTFEYTDSEGVIHFTDDPSKVPAAIRNSKTANKTPSLTTEESKTLDVMMKLDKIHEQDVPVKVLPDFKRNVKQFGEAFKDELGDPAEPKDSRLSTPEGTWNLFREGLKRGNLSYIKLALIGKGWDNGAGYNEMTSAQLYEFYKFTSEITIIRKEQNENAATLHVKNNKTGVNNTIDFINFYGNWKMCKF